jgi:hypothetical protein
MSSQDGTNKFNQDSTKDMFSLAGISKGTFNQDGISKFNQDGTKIGVEFYKKETEAQALALATKAQEEKPKDNKEDSFEDNKELNKEDS